MAERPLKSSIRPIIVTSVIIIVVISNLCWTTMVGDSIVPIINKKINIIMNPIPPDSGIMGVSILNTSGPFLLIEFMYLIK